MTIGARLVDLGRRLGEQLFRLGRRLGEQLGRLGRRLAGLPGRWWAVAGLVATTLAGLAATLLWLWPHLQPNPAIPFDLRIYRDAGVIAEHGQRWHAARQHSPLYDWAGYRGHKFTYTPFAALVFIALTGLTSAELVVAAAVVSVLAVAAAVWYTLGGLSVQNRAARAGLTLLGTVGAFALEPVLRTLSLGQVELALMALVVWDLCQPDTRWWKGAGVGIAAGLKLLALIFIPYLILTRRFRQAAVAAAVFAATVAAGFVLLPADSRTYWLDGTFADGSRAGFASYAGNQSLRGTIARLAGDSPGALPWWLAAASLTLLAGLICAARIHRAGHPVLGVLCCALTGLLVSPVSWDHHWIWIIPAVAAALTYAARSRGPLRWSSAGLATLMFGLFAAWPVSLWATPDRFSYHLGLIWVPPASVYHWHGAELLLGNLYVLTGIALLLVLAAAAGWMTWRGDSGAATVSAPAAEPASRDPSGATRAT